MSLVWEVMLRNSHMHLNEVKLVCTDACRDDFRLL